MPYIGNKNTKFSVRPPSPPPASENLLSRVQQFASSYNLQSTQTAVHQTVPTFSAPQFDADDIMQQIQELQEQVKHLSNNKPKVETQVVTQSVDLTPVQTSIDSAHNQLFLLQSQVSTLSDTVRMQADMIEELKKQLLETAEAVVRLQLSTDDEIDQLLSKSG